jgi:hypothetical protein
VTARTITCAVSRADVIHFAIATFGAAPWSLTAIFCAALGSRSGEAPDVVALPLASAFV